MTGLRPFLVAGEERAGEGSFEVRNPYDGSVVAEVATPTDRDVSDAVLAAATTFEDSRKLPVHVRAEALSHVSRRLQERADEVARTITLESGKPIKWARIEAARAVSTFRWAAEEARREGGEVMRLDTEPALGSRLGIVRRFPLGPVLGITPFNFPVNLVAHKVAPAIAVGAPIVVKPADKTPLGALLLAELLRETDLPAGMISVLPLPPERTEPLVRDPAFKVVSFTGSTDVGWKLKAMAPKAHFILELGGNAACIVHEDADLDHAATRIAVGGYAAAGQSCIAAQRVLIHGPVYDEFVGKYVAAVKALKAGDPMDELVDVGPMINEAAAKRIEEWVEEARGLGAEVLTGGKRDGVFYEPTVVANAKWHSRLCKDEVFAPVTTVHQYPDFDEAIVMTNDSRFGLQAGVFTQDLGRAMQAHRDLEVGGVILNDVSAYRADQMPYGGWKDSGLGREGFVEALNGLTESRVLVIHADLER